MSYRSLNISSKVLTGDLLLRDLAKEKETLSKNKYIMRFNPDKYQKVVGLWLRPENMVWSAMIYDRVWETLDKNIFTICFETIEMQLAEYLNDQLSKKAEFYLGGIEVDEASYVHWYLYSNSIGPRYRLFNKTASIFWDGISEDSKDEGRV